MIFFTETKCKIRFIYVGFNCKRKTSGVKKCLEIMTIKGGGLGGGLTPNGKNILNFHFDYLHISLNSDVVSIADLYAEEGVDDISIEFL